MKTMSCQICNSSFEARNPTQQLFCSHKCAQKNYKIKHSIKTNCKTCNKEIIVYRKRKELEKGNVFCSRTCSATYSNTHRVRQLKQYICTGCNQPFTLQENDSSKSRCLTCRQLNAKQLHDVLLNTPIKDFYINTQHLHPAYKLNRIRTVCRRWNQDLTKNGCQVCGYKHHVEFAHIKPLSSFPETATIGEVNSPDNIYILCPNHHWEFDNGILTAIPTRI